MAGFVTTARWIKPPFIGNLNSIRGYARPRKVTELSDVVPQRKAELNYGDTRPTLFQQQVETRCKQTTYSYRTVGTGDSKRSDVAQNLYDYSYRNRYAKLDTGHPFWTTQEWSVYDNNRYRSYSKGSGFVKGMFSPSNVAPLPSMPALNAEYFGNKAINILAPTTSAAHVAQDWAEILRDGITFPGHSLIGENGELKAKIDYFRSLGSEYLNVAFNWLPFVSSITSTVASLQKANQQIMQLQRDSGLLVRRDMRFDPIITTKVTDFGRLDNSVWQPGGFNLPNPEIKALLPGDGSLYGSTTVSQQTYEQYSFAGAFTYYLHPGNGLLDRLERYNQYANKLLGNRITPAVLWELLPFSWLADWFLDVQSALKRMSLFQNDSLVLPYSYMMRTTVLSSQSVCQSDTFGGLSQGQYFVKKERIKGTPFGFGKNPISFTGQQWAILTALGLTLAPKTLG